MAELGEDGGRVVGGDEAIGLRVEVAVVGDGVVAGGVHERGQRGGGVACARDRRAQQVRAEIGRPIERVERRERSLGGEHRAEGPVGGRVVARCERVAKLDGEEARRRPQHRPHPRELLPGARAIAGCAERVEARERVARLRPRRIARRGGLLGAQAWGRRVLRVREERRPRQRPAAPDRAPAARGRRGGCARW